MDSKVSSFFSCNLSYIYWISNGCVSSISCVSLWKLFKYIDSYFLVSLIKPKTISSIFSFNLSPMFINLKANLLTNDRKRPIEALFYFEQIRSEIQRNFRSTLLSLIPIRFWVSVKINFSQICLWNRQPITPIKRNKAS